MNRAILIISVVLVCCLVAAGITLSAFIDVQPPTPQGVVPGTPHEEVVRMARERNFPSKRAGAKAVADTLEHNFGMMDPNSLRVHTFEIRNEGFEALKLGKPRTTCQCGTAELQEQEIPSGGTAELTVRLEPGPDERLIDVAFIVPTSDPEKSELVFHVKGTVKHMVFADPPRIAFTAGSVEQQGSTHEILVFSEIWKDFQLEEIRSTLDGVTWQVEPASPQHLAEKQGALAGYVLKVDVPADLRSGTINERLMFTAVSSKEEGETSSTYQIPIEGFVRGRIGFYGGAIDAQGVVHVGKLTRGYGKRIQLTVKVRDREPELPNLKLEVKPDFVQATMTPLAGAAPGLYLLVIDIPDDAPLCSHLLAHELGTIRVASDHPRVPEKTLRLEFAVLGNDVLN